MKIEELKGSKELDTRLQLLTETHNQLFSEFLELNTDYYLAGFAEGWDSCFDEMFDLTEKLKEEMCSKCHSAKLNDCCKCEWGDENEENIDGISEV